MRISIKLLFLLVCVRFNSLAQSNLSGNRNFANPIQTAVPFLTISPDARSGAMGDAGVAITPDGNSMHWNPSKLAFLENPGMLSLSYSPWLKNIVPNVFLSYGTFVQKLDDRNTIGASFRYFNLGNVELYDEHKTANGTYHPYEFSIDGSIARKFGENFSLGLTFRYLYSLLTNTTINQGQSGQGNRALAADVSLYIKRPTIQFGKEALFAFGVNISNIGGRISYSGEERKYFLPTNLKLGVSNTWFMDDYSTITLAFDINKLLVPTPPVRDENNLIISGEDDNKTVVQGIFNSFTDAPRGFSEEIRELSFSSGIEYNYNRQFALRAGYCYEHPDKGNRRYLTMGAGFTYRRLTTDFCYLHASQEKSPVANTLRLSVSFYLSKAGAK